MITGKYQKYPKTLDSGISWLSEIPTHWEIKRFKNIFKIKKRIAGEVGFDILSITQKGIKVKDTESGDGQLSMDYSKYQLVYKNDFAMNHMDLLTGYVDISKFDGVTSPDYRVFALEDKNSYDRYFLYLLQLCYKANIFYPLGQGAANIGRWRLPTEAFNEFLAPIPPLKEQETIADFLDHENDKINTLIDEQRQLMQLLKEKRLALVHSAIVGAKEVRLGNCSKIISRPILNSADEVYTPIGLFNRGRGIFHKEPTLGCDLGDSEFYHIEPHDLILSGQFAWEGAVALADEEDLGCIASHRYPIINGKSEILDTSFLWAFLTSHTGDFLLNESSRGAAGRNKPLNINYLMKEKIPLPTMQSQLAVAKIVHQEKIINEKIKNIITTLEERRISLISAACTGKIDVRDWKAIKQSQANKEVNA